MKSFSENGLESKIYVALPFVSRTHDFVDSSIFIKPSRLDLSHGSNFLEPPVCLQEALTKASVWGDSIAQYDSPYGPNSLRELVAEYESRLYGDSIGIDNVFITLGGADGLALYFRCRASDLDLQSKPTALLLGPQYPTIARIAEAAGFAVGMTKSTIVDSQICEAAILELRPHTVVLTQPSNPFGTFVSDEDFSSLCLVCSNVGADIVIDRVCGDFASAYYSQSPKYRIIAREKGVRLSEIESYSKRRGLPGLRIGYNIMSPEDVRWCANAVTGRTASSIGCAVAESDILAFINSDEVYTSQVINNHAVVRKNCDLLIEALGSKLINYSKPENGANFVVSVLLPKPMLESVATLWLHKTYHLGTYPISCFELWPELEATKTMRIRITAATQPSEFEEAVDILLSALSETN